MSWLSTTSEMSRVWMVSRQVSVFRPNHSGSPQGSVTASQKPYSKASELQKTGPGSPRYQIQGTRNRRLAAARDNARFADQRGAALEAQITEKLTVPPT